MITAILPVFPGDNSFWLSSKGRECIYDFLNWCGEVDGIDRLIVNTTDHAVKQMSGELGFEFQHLQAPVKCNLHYTFEKSWETAVQFRSSCSEPNDGLLILDHRNLLLTPKAVQDAIALFRSSGNAVVSITPCLDRPGQYHAFSLFADCLIIDFPVQSETDCAPRFFRKPSPSNAEPCRQVSIEVIGNSETGYLLTFHAPKSEQGYILHILPFSEGGPLFAESLEIFASGPTYDQRLAPEVSHWSGIICILSTPAEAGEYDMVEVFSPPNAPWQIRSFGPTLFRKEDHKPMTGRQQFPEAYEYDGSLCLLSQADLSKNPAAIAPVPITMPHSRIVTDWVDYYYAAAIRCSDQKQHLGGRQ